MYLEEINIQSPLHSFLIRPFNSTTHAIYEETPDGEKIVYTGGYWDCVRVMKEIGIYHLGEKEVAQEKKQ